VRQLFLNSNWLIRFVDLEWTAAFHRPMLVTRNPRGHVLHIISGLFARRRFSARQPLSSNRIPERAGCLPATNVCELNIYRDNTDIPISPSVFACTHSLRISLSIDPHYAIIVVFLSHPMREARRRATQITRFVPIYFLLCARVSKCACCIIL